MMLDGRSMKLGLNPEDVDPVELAKGTRHELEHTSDTRIAERIALDHLAEHPHYYTHLSRMEAEIQGAQ